MYLIGVPQGCLYLQKQDKNNGKNKRINGYYLQIGVQF